MSSTFLAAAASRSGGLKAVVNERRFDLQSGVWRSFEVTTRVEIAAPSGKTRVWIPVPSVNAGWQRSLESTISSNGSARIISDDGDGVCMVHAEFDAVEGQPFVEVTSRIRTQSRVQD